MDTSLLNDATLTPAASGAVQDGRALPLDRVVILNDSFEGRGGAAQVAAAEIEALRARGVPVTIITGAGSEFSALREAGVEILSLSDRPLLEVTRLRGGVRGLFNVRAAKMVDRWIDAHDTPRTVYHLHNWAHILSPSIFHPLRRVSERLVMTLHDYFIACPNGGYLNYQTDTTCHLRPLSVACLATNCDRRHYAHKLWRAGRQAIRQALFNPDREQPLILTLHEAMTPYIRRAELRTAQLHVLRNPIEPFRRARVAAEENQTFVFVGRLEREKGPDLAARAVAAVNGRLRLIGDGPMRAELEARFPQFEFTGWRAPSEIGELVGDARALIMSSRVPEPFGIAAVQALWSGLPVLIAEDALLAQEIEAAQAGLSCNPRDTGKLAAIIERLLEDDTLVAEMSRRAHGATGHLGNSPAAWTEKLLSLLASRIAGAPVEG